MSNTSSAVPTSLSAPVPLDDTLGAFFIGVVWASCLWGVIVQQAYRYLCSFPSDPWPIRGIVLASLVSETVQEMAICFGTYHILVTNYGNITAAAEISAANPLQLFTTPITAILVKSFFLYRIYRLSGNKLWLVSILLVPVLGEFITIFSFAIITSQRTFFVQLAPFVRLSSAGNVSGATADIMIALALCGLLLPQRTIFRRSRTIVNDIMLFAAANGVLTSMCAIAILVTTNRLFGQDWSVALTDCLGRLHVNALLTTLNAREKLRAEAVSRPTLYSSDTYLHQDGSATVSRTLTKPGLVSQPSQEFAMIRLPDNGKDQEALERSTPIGDRSFLTD